MTLPAFNAACYTTGERESFVDSAEKKNVEVPATAESSGIFGAKKAILQFCHYLVLPDLHNCILRGVMMKLLTDHDYSQRDT